MNDKQGLGKWGEEHALTYLKKKGYRILNQNWRTGRFEVDIIARDNNILVFVEVKTRSNRAYGNPEEAVRYEKSGNLLAAAQQYIADNNYEGELRIDVISIVKTKSQIEIRHIEDAVAPEL